jgi:hypothetical protein
MIEKENTNHDSSKTNNGHRNSEPSYLRLVFICGGIAVAGLLIASIWWPNLTERTKFFTGNLLNLIIALAVIAQVLIYRKQWNAMAEGLEIERDKTSPRLRVAEVTAESFETGKRPFYVVTIANDGLLAATDVRIHMSIEINDEKPMDWINDVVVTIPANGKEHHFIHSSSWLSEEQLDGFDNSKDSLRVVGFFEYASVGRIPICYKYLPLQGEYRPPKIPQFVPCDYTPSLNTTLHVQGAVMKTTVGNITATVGTNPQGEIRPSGELTTRVIKKQDEEEDEEG